MRAWLIIAAWLIFTAGALWAFEGRYLLPVKKGIATETPKAVPGKVILTVAWGSDCACSLDEVDHLAKLTREFGPKGFEIHILIPCLAKDVTKALAAWQATGVPGVAAADPDGGECRKLGLTATPSSIVQDRHGAVVFRGSLHAGRFCHNEDLAFAEKAIEATLAGREPKVKETPFYGCALSF